jgi:glucose/arabinose dehydrogenase
MTKNILPDQIENFGFPITLAFSKDGRAYLSERMTGRLWQVDHGKQVLIKTFPVVPLIGHHETGFFGIALDPDFERSESIYCYYTAGTSEKDFKNRVVRVKADGTGEMVVLDNLPAGVLHNGGIMAFGPDKTLYVGVGENYVHQDLAQDVNFLGGKILRINRDGSIPEGNPFPNSPVYSYGHRNIFGLAFHPTTTKLYVSDVGPNDNDEINLIEKGGNYGWPIVKGVAKDSRFIDPLITYTPTITPTQSVFVGNDLYFGSFNEGTVHKLTLGGENFAQVVKDEIVYRGKSLGVIGVFYSPDNQFYVVKPDRVLRFTPETS